MGSKFLCHPVLHSNLPKQPPLQDDHLSKSTNAESAQANSYTIIIVQDDHLPNETSDQFFCPPNEQKQLSKTATAKLYPEEKC